jgi:LPXTG-motif cell wall-anchored protein
VCYNIRVVIRVTSYSHKGKILEESVMKAKKLLTFAVAMAFLVPVATNTISYNSSVPAYAGTTTVGDSNGKTVVGSSSGSTSSTTKTSSPATGDNGVGALSALALTVGASALVLRKKK